MAVVPVYRRTDESEEDQGNALQVWRGNPLDEDWSLWDSFFDRGSLFDPLLFRRFMVDPFDAFPLWDYSRSSIFAKDARAVANTRVDWWESVDAHYIQADLPGATKDDVEVLVENGRVLQISGKSRNTKSSSSDGRFRLGERSRVGYLRRLRLPSNSDAAGISAEIENGVLTVTIPKRATGSGSDSQNIRVVEIQE